MAAAAALANKEEAFLHNFHLRRMFVINSLELNHKTVHSCKIDHVDNYLAVGCQDGLKIYIPSKSLFFLLNNNEC